MPTDEFDERYRDFLEHEQRRRWFEEREELVRRYLDFAAWASDMYGMEVELKTPNGAQHDSEMLRVLRKINAGAAKGRKRALATRRAQVAREDETLLTATRRLENADPPLTKGEIIDKLLLLEYGRAYDPSDGDDYEKARQALRKQIKRARRRRKESLDA